MRNIPFLTKPLTAGLAAALLLAGTAAGAATIQTQSDPIHVDHVQVTYQRLSEDDASRMPIATEISFTNEYSAPATDVVFLLLSNGAVVDRFEDVGSFAPGVLIRHGFPENELGGAFSVVVAAASFVDGTKWQNAAVGDVARPAPIAGTAASDY